MRDPDRGKYNKLYMKEFILASKILQDEAGGIIGWSDHDYQAFFFKTDDVHLIFYPHKVKGTGNKHIRVRNQNSKDINKAKTLMKRLYNESGFNCTFYSKVKLRGK